MAQPNLEDYANRVQAIRTKAESDIAAVRADVRLSVEGKREKVDRIRDTANRSIAGLHEQYEAAVQSDTLRARKRVFERYIAVDPIAQRDAVERAQKVQTEEEALGLFAVAKRLRDESLMRELALVGITRQWVQLVNAYGDANPLYADDLEVVWYAEMQAQAQDPRALMAVAMAFMNVNA